MKDLPRDVKKRLDKLAALEAGGVDNWGYYHDALEEWNEKYGFDDIALGIVERIIDELTVSGKFTFEEPAGRGAGWSIIGNYNQLAEIVVKEMISNDLAIKE